MAYTPTATLRAYTNNPEITPVGSTAADLLDELQLGGAKYSVVSGTSQQAVNGSHYVANNASLVTITLPATSAVGSVLSVTGQGAGGWRVAQNALQIIHKSGTASTTGVGGHIDSGTRYDAVSLICVVANLEWTIIASQGTIGIT